MAKSSNTESVVFIGIKPFMNYVVAAMSHLNIGKSVILRARGKHITRAVDVAEVLKNKFLEDLKIDSIEVGSEKVTNKEGRSLTVSTMDIVIKP